MGTDHAAIGTKCPSRVQILTCQDLSSQCPLMASIKISSKVEEQDWKALQDLAKESHQSISGLLTEAIRDYVRKRRMRPSVMYHLEDSIEENEELGQRLAR